MILQHIAKINTGLVLSRKKADDTSINSYKYKVITLKSILNNELDQSIFDDFVSKERISSKYLTKAGDVILRISEPYSAILISLDLERLIVPSSFYLIRININKIIPDYLYWFLKSESAKKQILSQKNISTMNVIKSSFIRSMNIPLPDLKIQQSISNLSSLQKRELQLLDELKQEKQLLYSGLIKKVFDEKCEH